jgi:hypothetical protein
MLKLHKFANRFTGAEDNPLLVVVALSTPILAIPVDWLEFSSKPFYFSAS